MARFRGTIWGNRGEASRLGTPASGLDVTCNGWQGGVKVHASVDAEGNDVFQVYATGGSGYGDGSGFICQVDHNGQQVPA